MDETKAGQEAGTVDVLRKAKALVEKGWTRGAYARDADGREVSPGSALAVCWCPYGALSAAQGTDADASMTLIDQLFAGVAGGAVDWNDRKERTQAEVLAAFDKAIALAQEQPARPAPPTTDGSVSMAGKEK